MQQPAAQPPIVNRGTWRDLPCADQQLDDLSHVTDAGSFRHLHGQPGTELRRQRQHLVFRSAQHHAMELHRQLLEIRGAARLPAVLVSLGGAVALREREETSTERVLHELKQDEQVAGPVRQRRPGEEVHRSRPGGAACFDPVRQLPRQPAADASVVLQVVRLVEHQSCPGLTRQRIDVLREDVVVDDHPGLIRVSFRALLNNVSGRVGRGDSDLARPVPLDRGWTNNEVGSVRRCVPQRDDGLPRLAEAHVVGEDGATSAEEERDPLDLVRVETLGQSGRLAKSGVRIVRRQRQQLRERIRLCVERSVHLCRDYRPNTKMARFDVDRLYMP